MKQKQVLCAQKRYMSKKKIRTALVSVFHKEGLDVLAKKLHLHGVKFFSTGGTQTFLESLSIEVTPVEELTSYPSILGGRVKTLHPKVFGGILSRRELQDDVAQLEAYDIPEIDLVIVDLYPFETTVASGASEQDIIEKIDIGGISLIRAAAKNYKDVVILSGREDYALLAGMLDKNNGATTLEDRKLLATRAFNISSHYDSVIFNWFNRNDSVPAFKLSLQQAYLLRYGENPHQKGTFYGDINDLFEKHHGKELSYNNLLDVDAAVNLMAEFKNEAPTFAILKHNNCCGIATRNTMTEAYKDALAGDPVSAFGGILIANRKIDIATANQIHELFYEVLIAADYDADALELLKQKKNRVLLTLKHWSLPDVQVRSALNGILFQDKDNVTDKQEHFVPVTEAKPTAQEITDLEFANKIVKHTKSNTIVLAKNKQLLANGTGQTSRVDALNQAVHKANLFQLDLNGAVMASDAFFPFPDCVEIAHKAGITAVIQPGGSINDKLSIEYCNLNGLAMVTTGNRHFKH
ncbi:MAG: bifunctional phosphoribosylaminoimidazolecarboxamide formyltransferase/IMP cyclohydrolase [Flavobacteriales bacterium]